MSTPKIRRRVNELSLEDLDLYPVWEFADDEEGEDGQDETTVRPFLLLHRLDPSVGNYVVRARFWLADGSQLRGYLRPPGPGDCGIDSLQPVVVTDAGQVPFWHGSILPSDGEIVGLYQLLTGVLPKSVFPIRFASGVPLVGGQVAGTLPGFLHLADWRTGTISVLTAPN